MGLSTWMNGSNARHQRRHADDEAERAPPPAPPGQSPAHAAQRVRQLDGDALVVGAVVVERVGQVAPHRAAHRMGSGKPPLLDAPGPCPSSWRTRSARPSCLPSPPAPGGRRGHVPDAQQREGKMSTDNRPARRLRFWRQSCHAALRMGKLWRTRPPSPHRTRAHDLELGYARRAPSGPSASHLLFFASVMRNTFRRICL